MKNTIIIMGALVCICLVGSGIYGYVHDLKMWGAPLVFGFVGGSAILTAVDIT